MKLVKYKCKENDNLIEYHRDNDEKFGEFHFADELGKSWCVIGYKDMMAMMRKCGFVA